MKDKVLFVEYCADDFLGGTANMEPLEELAYRRICDLIYSTNDNLLDNDALQYATKTGAKWKKIREALISKYEKIYVENGFIRNKKCAEKIEKSRVNIDQKRVAQAAMIAKRNALKENETGLAAASAVATAAALANQRPNNQKKDVVVTSAREDEPPELPQQVTLSKRIGQITGWDTSPSWFGDYSRLEAWLAEGWDAELDILPTITRIVAQRKARSQDIPKTLNYFEQAVANAHATRLAPTPKGTPDANGRKPKKSIGEQAADILASLGHSESDEGFSGHLRGAEGIRQAD